MSSIKTTFNEFLNEEEDKTNKIEDKKTKIENLLDEWAEYESQYQQEIKKFEENIKELADKKNESYSRLIEELKFCDYTVVETSKAVVKVKKGYTRSVVEYKNLFETALTKVNSTVRAVLEKIKDENTKMTEVKSSIIASLKKINENKNINESVINDFFKKLEKLMVNIANSIRKCTKDLHDAQVELTKLVKRGS